VVLILRGVLLFNTTHMLSGPPSTGVLMWSKVHGGDSKGREGGSWGVGRRTASSLQPRPRRRASEIELPERGSIQYLC
jgi:hypothetical protein